MKTIFTWSILVVVTFKVLPSRNSTFHETMGIVFGNDYCNSVSVMYLLVAEY